MGRHSLTNIGRHGGSIEGREAHMGRQRPTLIWRRDDIDRHGPTSIDIGRHRSTSIDMGRHGPTWDHMSQHGGRHGGRHGAVRRAARRNAVDMCRHGSEGGGASLPTWANVGRQWPMSVQRRDGIDRHGSTSIDIGRHRSTSIDMGRHGPTATPCDDMGRPMG